MQQPSSREMQSINGNSPQPQIPLPDQHQQQQQQQQQQYDTSTAQDDFFDQMLSWDLSGGGGGGDESMLLASRLRQHQIGGGGAGRPGMGLQQLMLSPMATRSGADSGLIPMPLSLGSGDSIDVDAFKGTNTSGGDGLYNGFGASLPRMAPATPADGQQPFSHPQSGCQNYGAPASGIGQAQSVSGGSGGGTGTTATGTGTAPPRQRVRARRGQATDPHSIAERLRRERIAERMKALQELVPNANKTDKASMLDEIIDYVKFLQLQVKVLSMSRLGGAAAVAPLLADMSSEGPGVGGGGGKSSGAAAGGNDSLTVTEHQVAKLMEEDMGSAMQYLQGKGLCLMPISLASAISTATGHPRSSPSTHTPVAAAVAAANAAHHHSDGPASPSMSVLTAQSAMAAGEAEGSRPASKDAASISKP